MPNSPSLTPANGLDALAELATSRLAKIATMPIEIQVFEWIVHGDARSVIAAVKAHPKMLGSPGGPPLRVSFTGRRGPQIWETALLDLAFDRNLTSMGFALVREGAWAVGEAPPAPGVSGAEARLSIAVVEGCQNINDLDAGIAAIEASGRRALPWPRMLSAAIEHGNFMLAAEICEDHHARLSAEDIESLLGDDHGWTNGLFWVATDFSESQKDQRINVAGSHCQAVQQKLLTFFDGRLPSDSSAFIWTEAIVADRPDVIYWMASRGWAPDDWRATAPESRRNWSGSRAQRTLSKKEAKRSPSLVEAAVLEKRPAIFNALLSIPEAVAEFLANPPSVETLASFSLSMLKSSHEVGLDIFKVNAKRQNFLHIWAESNSRAPGDGWQSIAAINSEALSARDSNGKTPIEIQLSCMHHSGKAFEDFSKMAARIDKRAMASVAGSAPKRKASSRRL